MAAQSERGMPKGGEPAPVIAEQPVGRIATEGGYLALSVLATPATVTTRWWKDGQPLTNDAHLSGASNSVLVVSPVAVADSGAYRALAANGSGSVTSAVVSVLVNQLLVEVTAVGTNALMTMFGQPGEVYRVEVSVNFGLWRTNGYATNFTGAAQFFDVNTSGGFRRLRAKFDSLLPVLSPPNAQALAAGMRAYGVVNQVWRYQGTDDLQHWDNLTLVTNLTGWVKFPGPAEPPPTHHFYRLAPP